MSIKRTVASSRSEKSKQKMSKLAQEKLLQSSSSSSKPPISLTPQQSKSETADEAVSDRDNEGQESGEDSDNARLPYDDVDDRSDDRIRKRSKASYDEYFDDEIRSTHSDGEDDRNDQSFASSRDPRSRERESDTSRLLVPSNISINARYFVLKDTITTEEATKLHDQCIVPGFVNSIQSPHILIMKKAQYLISNRVLSREHEWATLFPNLPHEDIPDWVNKLTVLEAAKLVYTLFGPESTAQQSIDQKTVDVALREAPFNLNFKDEMVEDLTFANMNNILVSEIQLHGELSYDRATELSKIISNRLPVDSQIVSAYKTAMALLTEYQRKHDTPQKVILRIKKIMTLARQEIRASSKWLTQGTEFSTDRKGNLQPQTAKKGITPSAATTSKTTELCSVCGHYYHVAQYCRRAGKPGTNASKLLWADSVAGTAWKAAGFNAFQLNEPVPSCLISSSSSSASSNNMSTTQYPKQKMSSCKSQFLSSVHSSTHTTLSDFLPVTITVQSQTNRRAAEVATPTEEEEEEGANRLVQALLDTGSLAGNFVSQALITELEAEKYVYRSKRHFSVCSGLDNICYDSNKLINLIITYKNEQTHKPHSIFLTAFVAQNSPIDLIIGRSSIKKYNFHTSNPSHFVSTTKSSQSTNSTQFPIVKPSVIRKSVAFENGMKPTPDPKTPIFSQPENTGACGCTATHSKPMNLDSVDKEMAVSEGISSSPMNLDSDQNDFYDLNHNLLCQLVSPLHNVMGG
jgi:hypothetical protein